LAGYGHNDLSAYITIGLFSRTAPLNNSVEIISSEISSLTPQVRDKSNHNAIVPNHPILDLLEKPNADSTKSEFLQAYAAFYLITGNSYLMATPQMGGSPQKTPPLELFYLYPQQITIEQNARDGFAENITNNRSTASLVFKRDELNARFRFYDNEGRELWQAKSFNPNQEALIGQSPAASIFPEIDQYNSASSHNSSLLKRGGRPSGMLMASHGKDKNGVVKPLTDSQYSRLKTQWNNFYMGAGKAGGVFIAEGANVSYKDMITSNRDMDFSEGKKDVRSVIYNKYKIPLPFVNPERQTYANMGVAKVQLYDNAVFPVADRLFEELNIFLMPRYKNSENLFLTYDASDIPALKERAIREAGEKQKLGIYTDNELRALLGDEPYAGGNIVYKPGNLIPAGQDSFTGDEPPVPKTSKKRFSELMETKGYSREKIEEMSAVLSLK